MTPPKVREAERSYKLAEAAELKNVSIGYLRNAIKRTDGTGLAAKKVGKEFRVSASALEAFWDALPDG